MKSLQMNDALDIFTPNPNESKGVRSVPTTQEIRDKNERKRCIALMDAGYKEIQRFVQCSDGEEYEILEIQRPKASGSFFVRFYKAQIKNFLFCECGKGKLFRKFLL